MRWSESQIKYVFIKLYWNEALFKVQFMTIICECNNTYIYFLLIVQIYDIYLSKQKSQQQQQKWQRMTIKNQFGNMLMIEIRECGSKYNWNWFKYDVYGAIHGIVFIKLKIFYIQSSNSNQQCR